MDTWVIPPKRVTSPTCTWGPPYPCKQALMHPLWGWSPNTSPQKRLLVWILASHISVNNRLLQMSHSKSSCCRNDTKFVLQLVTRISLRGWWKAKMGWDSKNQWANHAEWFCLSPWLRSLILPYIVHSINNLEMFISFQIDFHNKTVNFSLFLFYWQIRYYYKLVRLCCIIN